MPDPRVAVIVLNYNGRAITLDALASVKQLDYPAFDVVHVDNGSSDGSFEAVGRDHPDVVQVRTLENLGVAGGYNLGMRWAVERGYDYLLILNNDIEVDGRLLAELVAVAESHPEAGCVGPKAYYYGDRSRIWSAGGILRFKESVTRERGMGEIDRGQWDRDEEVAYVNGCGMLIRRTAIEAAGLWDPLYHLAVEDADWCMRIRRCGFTIRYAHRAVLYHMVSAATGVYTPRRTYDTGRSTAIFVRRYAGPWQWMTFAFFYTLSVPVAFLRELRRSNQAAVLAKLRGVREGLRIPLTAPPMLAAIPLAADRRHRRPRPHHPRRASHERSLAASRVVAQDREERPPRAPPRFRHRAPGGPP